MKLQPASEAEAFKGAPNHVRKVMAATAKKANQDSEAAASPSQPGRPGIRTKVVKRARAEKPEALKNSSRIQVNCSLIRHDAINQAAAALGLSASGYLLLCEEQNVHRIVEHLTNFLETKLLQHQEQVDGRIAGIEAKLPAAPTGPA